MLKILIPAMLLTWPLLSFSAKNSVSALFGTHPDLIVSENGIRIIKNQSQYKPGESKPDSMTFNRGRDFLVKWAKDAKSGNWEIGEAQHVDELPSRDQRSGPVQIAKFNSLNQILSFSRCSAVVEDFPELQRTTGLDKQNRELRKCGTATPKICTLIKSALSLDVEIAKQRMASCASILESQRQLADAMRESSYRETTRKNNEAMEDLYDKLNRPQSSASSTFLGSNQTTPDIVSPKNSDPSVIQNAGLTMRTFVELCQDLEKLESEFRAPRGGQQKSSGSDGTG